MKRLLLCFLPLALAPALHAQTAEADVAAVVQRLFDGMRAADSAMVRSVFHPDARLVSTATADGEPVARVSGVDGFVEAVGAAEAVWDERLHGVEVRVDDHLATAWTPYSFYYGGEFSHCGVNAFQLVRTPAGWRIVQIADTRRQERCADGEAAASPRPGGHLFVVGGGSRPASLMRRFVELAGGPGAAEIVVLPLASSEPERTGRRHAEELRELGVEARSVVPTRAQAEDPDAAALLDGATGIWFSGGVQSRITDVLAGTPLNEAIRALYRAGAVIGGTSAGAAIMSDSMITGDQYHPEADTLGYYGDEFTRLARDYIDVVPGLGYLPGAIVDQHFVRRERHNRLISAVLERPGMMGVGIDESTALVVRPDGRWAVVGESAAVIYDARNAATTRADAPVLGASGVETHVVPGGGIFDPSTGRARLPADAAATASGSR